MIVGSGDPVTVAAHGLGATVAQTRLLLSGVPGTKLFPSARGHGDAPDPVAPGFGELADDLLAAAPAATQALGVSLGAGTLLRVLSQQPDRFTRVVLLLPAALEVPSPAVRRPRTRDEAQAFVLAEVAGLPVPPGYVEERVETLMRPGVQALMHGLDAPVVSRASLGAVTGDVLVVAQEGDPVHPASVAREVAASLPRARLHVFDRPGALVRERATLLALVVDHLS